MLLCSGAHTCFHDTHAHMQIVCTPLLRLACVTQQKDLTACDGELIPGDFSQPANGSEG